MGDPDIMMFPLAGWELADLPGAHVLLTVQYFPDEPAMRAGAPSVIRFVLSGLHALDLAEKLPAAAERSLARAQRENGNA